MQIWQILTIIMVILLIILVALYFIGRRLEKKQAEQQVEAEPALKREKPAEDKMKAARNDHEPAVKRRFTFKEQKEYAEIEGVIASKEGELKVVQLQMAENATNFGKLNELAKEETRLNAELEHLMERWEYLEAIAEEQA